jgi:hypothetical protein
MIKVTADPLQLAHDTVEITEVYMTGALRWVEDHAIAEHERIPLMCAFIQACSHTIGAPYILAGLQEIAEGLQRIGTSIEEYTESSE